MIDRFKSIIKDRNKLAGMIVAEYGLASILIVLFANQEGYATFLLRATPVVLVALVGLELLNAKKKRS